MHAPHPDTQIAYLTLHTQSDLNPDHLRAHAALIDRISCRPGAGATSKLLRDIARLLERRLSGEDVPPNFPVPATGRAIPLSPMRFDPLPQIGPQA